MRKENEDTLDKLSFLFIRSLLITERTFCPAGTGRFIQDQIYMVMGNSLSFSENLYSSVLILLISRGMNAQAVIL
jgi:hypothetical protein